LPWSSTTHTFAGIGEQNPKYAGNDSNSRRAVMYRRVEDFLTDFAAEAESTLALFRGIPDSAAGQAIGDEGRTLGRLAWHLACSIGEICGNAGSANSSRVTTRWTRCPLWRRLSRRTNA